MVTLAFRFLARRYHATPWGRHVNEGQVEWPPSPWRILRALLAAGFAHEGWAEDALPSDVRSLFKAMADVVPDYRLPEAVVAHTRHYMPIRSGAGERTTLVLDTFLRFTEVDAELLVRFPSQLPEPLHALLARLARGVGYLGRAESWVECEVVSDAAASDGWCRPLGVGATGDFDVVDVLCADRFDEYEERRDAALNAAITRQTVDGKKLSAAKRRKLESTWPADVLDSLLSRTSTLRAAGWTNAPASRQVRYARPRRALTSRVRPAPRQLGRTAPVETMLLALSSDTERGDLLPAYTRALPQAELLHRAIVARLDDETLCSALTGRYDDGTPARGHGHVHFLPLDLAGCGRIDHVLLWSPMGLDGEAQRAVRGVSRTWTKGSDHDLVVTCVGHGGLVEIAESIARNFGKRPAVLGRGCTWSSVTPFVPPRHIKARRDTLEAQVQRELEVRGLPIATEIHVLGREELLGRSLHEFVRRRRAGRPQPPRDCIFGLRLSFATQIEQPVALGYASHFGLGLFGCEN